MSHVEIEKVHGRRIIQSKDCGAASSGLMVAVAALGLTACEASHEPQSVESSRQSLTETEVGRVLGFESPTADWQIVWNGPGSLSSSTTATQGQQALAVNAHGYVAIQSVPISSLGTPIGNVISYDVRLPNDQPDPNWYGATQLYVSIPSLGLSNAYVGQVELTGCAVDNWFTVSYALSADLQAKLAGSYEDLTFMIVVNVPTSATGAYLVDNLRLSGAPPVGGAGAGGSAGGGAGAGGSAGGGAGAGGSAGGGAGAGGTAGEGGNVGEGGSSGGGAGAGGHQDGGEEPWIYTVRVTVLGPSGAPLPNVSVFALNEAGKVFFTGLTDADGVASVSVDTGSYRFGAGDYFLAPGRCQAPACDHVTIQTEDRGSFGWGLSEAESPGKAMDLGGFDVRLATGEALINVGTVAAGTTVRVGTYHAWGDLLGAYTIGDTVVTLYERKDGNLVKLARNDDAGMDPAQVATEDVRGASYVSFTLARSALLAVGVACKSERCRGSLRLKGDVDSNGGLKDVAAAIGRIDSDNETNQRHLLRIAGKSDWYSPYQEGSNHKHFQGIQRLRTGDDYQSLDTRGLALSGSATGELFHIRYPTRYPDPPTLGPLPQYGTSMHRWLYGNDGKTNHFGGIQASGHYLGGGFDGNDGQGMVVGLDMNQISGDMPVKIFQWWPGRNASAVGLAKITGQNAPMVMAIGGPDTDFVRMMRKPPNPWGYTNPARNDIKVSWLPYTLEWPSPVYGDSSTSKWPDGSLDVTTEWPNSIPCCSRPGVCEPNSYCGSSRQLFQSLQLVVQSDPVTHAYKRLFLAGAYASEELYSGRLEDGTDELTLFEVYLSESILRAPVSQKMGLVAKRRVPLNGDRRMIFHCTFGGPDNDWRRCSFNASFGLYVDPDHDAVSAFSSRAWASTDGAVDLVEFAPRVVTLPPIADNQVVMCTDHYYMGTCRVLTVTEKFFAHAEFMGSNGQGLTNDWVSSIRVGAKVKLDIFDQSEFRFHLPKGSDWITLPPGDYPTLGSFNDIISSAIVSPLDEDAQRPKDGQVSVCEGKNGSSLCSVLGRGRYPKSGAEASEVDGTGGTFGMYNDWMSSVIVPPGGQVRLFYDTEFGGGNNLYIKNNDIVTKTYNLSDFGWDERVSSVIVL